MSHGVTEQDLHSRVLAKPSAKVTKVTKEVIPLQNIPNNSGGGLAMTNHLWEERRRAKSEGMGKEG